jgi:hypothetical protein
MTRPRRPSRPVARVQALGVCEDCGQVHDFCSAHPTWVRDPETRDYVLDEDGERILLLDDQGRPIPCRRPANAGQTVCGSHGGSNPAAKKAAAKRMERENAMDEVGKLLAEAELEIAEMNGVEQLTHAITTAGAMALAYRRLLDELPLESEWSFEESRGANGGVQRFVNVSSDGLVGPDARGQMRLHAYEEGLRHWTRLHGELLKNAAVLGIEERRNEIAAGHADRICDAIVAMVEGLGRDLDDPEVAPIVDRALLAITGGEGG